MTHQQEEDEQVQATITFVKNALEDLIIKGPTGAMYRLMEKNLRKRGDFKLTRRLYLALTEHVTQVVSNKPPGVHDALIDALFSFDFVIKDMSSDELVDAEALRDAFATCALSFVSAKATLSPNCLRMLIDSLQQLSYVSGTIRDNNGAASEQESTSPGVAGLQEKESKLEVALRVRIVNLVLRVVKLVPTAGASLVGPLLAENFPHRFRPVQCLRCYVRGVLEVARELPRISSDLVALLVERCLEIDVEIKLDDTTGSAKLTGASGGGGGDDSGDESDEDINLLGFGSPLAVNSGKVVNYIGVTPSSANSDSKKKKTELPPPVAVDEMAEKLDMLMLELFEHIDVAMAVESTCENDNRRAREETARLWNAIHGTFQAKILLTHRSKFVQFLLLRFCALKPDYALVFANGLYGMCVDRMVPHVRRTNAVHFLASFAVRTTALSLTAIADISTRLLNWVVGQLPAEEEQHRLRSQTKSLSKDMRGAQGGNAAAGLLDPSDLVNHRLGVLYSVSQAIFYIMCFKGGAFNIMLHSNDEERASLHELMVASTWGRLCHSPLQPLAYCLERVRVEFLATCRRLKLLTREESYSLLLKSDETLRALSTMAGLDLTHCTPNNRGGNYPATPRSTSAAANQENSLGAAAADNPRTPRAGIGGAREVWSVPIRTPGSSLSSASIMATPKAKQAPHSAMVSCVSGAGEFNKSNPLDSFFPFDPYLLRNSFCFVSDIYCEWEPCYEEEDGEDEAERANHELSDGSVRTDDTSVAGSDSTEDSDSDSVASDVMDVTRHSDGGSQLGTSYGSVSMMSVDSAPASPYNPSPLTSLNQETDERLRHAREQFEVEEVGDEFDESDDPYETAYVSGAGTRRPRAESIGDW